MIYSFKCACGSIRDVEQSIHAEVTEPFCTDCHGSMQRIWFSPPVTFTGTGFYSTDQA